MLKHNTKFHFVFSRLLGNCEEVCHRAITKNLLLSHVVLVEIEMMLQSVHGNSMISLTNIYCSVFC